MKKFICTLPLLFLFTLFFLSPRAAFGEENASAVPEAAPMFPFVISYDAPENASNVSHFLDAPAGKHGFVRVKDGQFQTDAGVIRFHATNITGPANFPSHENSDRIAARLARLGINCVRMHFMDTWYSNFMEKETQGILADASRTQRNLCPKQLEKMDYMIAAFKKHGIYVDLNLHVGRTLDERDGFPASSWANKGFGQFVPGMIELQKEYAKQLLTHVNPYTGNAYTDEPSVAMIEITNEDSFQSSWFNGTYDRMNPVYKTELQKQWNAWVHAKYPTLEALQSAWKSDPKPEPLGENVISGGEFDEDSELKSKNLAPLLAGAQAKASVEDGVLKFVVEKDSPDPYCPKLIRKLSVKKDRMYTLSFRIRRTSPASGSAEVSAAVASNHDGWRSCGLQKVLRVGTEWTQFEQTFFCTETDADAFIQLTRFNVGTYEIDGLSFRTGGKITFNPSEGYAENAMPLFQSGSPVYGQALRDFGQFLEDTEVHYWLTMYRWIKEELKAKAPVSGTQIGYSADHVQAMLDYTDAHGYWRHPSGNHTSLVEALAGRERWSLINDSMVNGLNNILYIGAHRVAGKPYTISEYNHPYPNQYGAEGQPFLAVFGRLQGWGGIFQYSYNHFVEEWEPDGNPWCVFDSIARTDVLAHFPACSAAFLRGDVSEAKNAFKVFSDTENYAAQRMSRRAISNFTDGLDTRLLAMHGVSETFERNGSVTPAELPKIPQGQSVFVSDTGEITWNREIPGKAYVAVNTENTKMFTGFPEGRTIPLGGVTLTVGKTRLNWATVSLTDRFGTKFGKTGKATVLLAATGDCGNTDRVKLEKDGNVLSLTNRGHGPVLAEGIPAVLTFEKPASAVKCYALDPRGERKAEVPVTESDGKAEICIDPKYQTVWYELELE